MTFGGQKFCLPAGGAFVGFREIDLSGIKQVQMTAAAPSQYNFAGGQIELHLGSPDGKLAAEPQRVLPAAGAGFAPSVLKIPIFDGTQGMHDVYFVFKNDTAAASQSLMTVMGFVFQNEEMTLEKALPEARPSDQKVDLNEFVGKYKFSGLPFEILEIFTENGQLMASTKNDKPGPLFPTPQADKFDGDGKAFFEFIRENGKVAGVKLMPPGMSFLGKKE